MLFGEIADVLAVQAKMALEPSSNFSQQGSLDWVSLSTNFVSLSYGMVQRLSGSNLDLHTLNIGCILGGKFQLSRNGQRNISKALEEMKAYAGLQNVLWFGFGMKHPARVVGMTQQGSMLVALCAALSECFPHETAAEILSDMASLEDSLDMTPSPTEWLALIKSCAGILSKTVFPIRAETLMGLETDNKPADTTDIAKVLSAIAKITKNEWVSITIHGGKEARWIGALAEWLFDLTVTVTNEQDEIVYTSCPEGQFSQVNICSVIRPFPGEGASPTRRTGEKMLELADRTFYIDIASHFWEKEPYRPHCVGGRMETPVMNGRVAWKTCLSVVFGVLFKDLMKSPGCVGKMISSAARVYACISAAEEEVETAVLENNMLYAEASFGAGFVHNLLYWFPELSEFEPYLDQDSNIQTYREALKTYRISLKELRKICDCVMCNTTRPIRGKQPTVNCQVVLIELILRLGRLLSITECAEGLCPKFTGLRKLYNMRAGEHRAASPEGPAEGYYPDPPGLHRYRREDLKPPKKTAFVVMDNFPSHMEHALCLFTGHTSKDLNSDFSSSPAVSIDGVCIHLHILREIPGSPPDFAMLHVCPGQILHEGKKFSQLTDRHLRSKNNGWDKMKVTTALLACAIPDIIGSVKLAVRQTVNQLYLHYDIFYCDDVPTGLQLRPYSLCESMLYSYRRLHCGHSSASETDWGEGLGWDSPYNDTINHPKPELLHKWDEENRYITWNMTQSTFFGRCAVVQNHRELVDHGNSLLIVRDGECLSCCRKIRDMTVEAYKAEHLVVVAGPDPRHSLKKST
ncbi:hypothetical protein V496_01417 [Pseudogymnoascus sp. VKM F-4515 (FW-2607)]|nr:hypothetical protein V496_01417 [Pseudogymnoascus sp. VKM F-4515 (FW-2607)]